MAQFTGLLDMRAIVALLAKVADGVNLHLFPIALFKDPNRATLFRFSHRHFHPSHQQVTFDLRVNQRLNPMQFRFVQLGIVTKVKA